MLDKTSLHRSYTSVAEDTYKYIKLSLSNNYKEKQGRITRPNKGSQLLVSTMNMEEAAQQRPEHYKIPAFGESAGKT